MHGLLLHVLERGRDVFDVETGERLGRLDEEIGILRVEVVERRFSVAMIFEGRGFSRGNLVRPWEGRRP